jgi:putative colanic acid biosynthesis glycosyltransferase WcaI
MKVLLLNQFFHPDLSATAQIATDLAEDLAAAGLEVTALASRGTYLGGAVLPRRERHRGVDVVRVAATSLGKRTLLHRAVDYASFYATASLALATLPRHDVVVALTTPPLIAATGLVAQALKRSRLVCWVQDLYPEIAVAFGALREGSLAARAMRAISRRVLGRADAVVALGEAMRDRCVAAGAAPERTHVVPNWADAAAIRPVRHAANGLRAGLAAGAPFVAMYSGNMGRGHDVETLLDAARLLRAQDGIAFVFAGDGAKRPLVEAAARELPNVRLAPYQPRERLSESLSAADVHLVALSREVEGLAEPSKLYGIMAAGRPALYVGPERAEVARTLARADCGRRVANGDAPALAAAILALAEDPAARAEMGARARRALELEYQRPVATRRFHDVVVGLCREAAHRVVPAP